MRKIKILMFGWEFPPFSSGGLGTACYGLTKGLVRNGANITFVLPKSSQIKNEQYMKIISTENFKSKKGSIKFVRVDSILKPYISSKEYEEKFGFEKLSDEHRIYGTDLFSEVLRYAKKAKEIAKSEDFDVVHCHDWLTFLCGIEAKKVAKKKGKKAPLIVHVHATEFDRTIGNPNRFVYEIEQRGMQEANYIITVSEYTKNMILKHYNIEPKKVIVVHNSIDPEFKEIKENFKLKEKYKIVTFLGRITIQKGPLHFLWIAKKVLEKDRNVRFIVVGSGDMQQYMIEEAANLGIGDKILFMDFVSGEDVDRAYKFADVFVMPSISEPFGLAALEAVKNGVPAVVSKQSGVVEVLRNCLIADFWDINEMADKILALLNYNVLRSMLIEDGFKEVRKFSWDIPAKKCLEIYKKAFEEVS